MFNLSLECDLSRLNARVDFTRMRMDFYKNLEPLDFVEYSRLNVALSHLTHRDSTGNNAHIRDAGVDLRIAPRMTTTRAPNCMRVLYAYGRDVCSFKNKMI